MSRVTQIILRVRDTLADPEADRYQDAYLYRLLSEAQQTVSKVVGCLVKAVNLTVTAGQPFYDLPDDFLRMLRATYKPQGGVERVIPFMSHKAADELFPLGWESEEGRDTTHIIFGQQTVLRTQLYPIPTALTAGIVSLRYEYVASPLVYVSPTSYTGELILTPQYDLLLAFYVTGMALRASLDTQNRQMGEEELNMFRAELARVQDNLSQGRVANGSTPDSYVTPFQ